MACRDVCSGGSCHLLAISRLLRNGVFQGADESGQEYGNKTGVPEASHLDPQYHVQGIRLSLPLGEMGVGLLNLGVTGVFRRCGPHFLAISPSFCHTGSYTSGDMYEGGARLPGGVCMKSSSQDVGLRHRQQCGATAAAMSLAVP